jgi:hypothetical protein
MGKAKHSGIPSAATEDPVEVDGANPSKKSVIRTATALQSSVKPDDYPADEREQQVAAATGKGKGGRTA